MKREYLSKKVILNLIGLLCVLPFAITLIYSFKGLDGGVGLSQYTVALFQNNVFMRAFWNSFIYTFCIIGFNIPLSLLAGYAIVFFRFKGRNIAFWLYIVLMMIPFQAMVVPQYLTLKFLGILNSPSAVILPNIFFTLGTFLMAQYMQSIDKNLLEAGRIDGLNSFGLFRKIVLPLCKPGIFTLIILTFVNYWSMVEQPLLFMNDKAQWPLSAMLNNISGELGNIVYACGVIFSVLPLLLYIMFYDNLRAGISLTVISGATEGETVRKNERTKRVLVRISGMFLLAMLVCTFLTKQLEPLMLIDVTTARLEPGIIIENGKTVSHLKTLPIEAIRYIDGVPHTYRARQDKQTGENMLAESWEATIVAQDDRRVAVLFAPPEVIHHSSREIEDGAIVRVVQ